VRHRIAVLLQFTSFCMLMLTLSRYMLLLAGVLAVAAVATGCGDAATGRRITYNCSANAAEIAALEAELPAFAERTGITLSLNPFSGEEKLYAMMAAGTAPDVFYTNTVVRDRLASEGRLLDLRPMLAKDSAFAARLAPDVRARAASIDGGVYAVGNWTFTAGVYCNTRLFAAAGIPLPDAEWTWDDMVAAARRLTVDSNSDGTPEQYGLFIPSHFIECFELMNHAPVRRDALWLEIAPESREVYERVLGLVSDGVMPDVRRVQAMGMQAAQMLAQGRVAMLVEAVPNASLYDALREGWDVLPLPRFAGREPRYFRAASGGLSIAATTGDAAAAWQALRWLIGEAGYYQPNPVLRDADVVAGWEKRYPYLAGTRFGEVWRRSVSGEGGDLRYFVRFSSWTMTAIMERLQPLLDRLWARDIGVDALVAEVPAINAAARRALDEALANEGMLPGFRAALRASLSGSVAT
jgi:multiple sugar transport system substrate-binding protein